MKTVIIGGGVIGLCTAFYLRKKGYDVTVLDETSMDDGASYGNAGHIVPSHFIPLASPGIVSQGIRWMLDASSPFYIKPRINAGLMKWGYTFWRQCGAQVLQKNTPHLQQLLMLSRHLFNDLKTDLQKDIGLQEKGLLVLYKTRQSQIHENEAAAYAMDCGMEARILQPNEVQEMEPATRVDVNGGVWYRDDAHLDPSVFMKVLREELVRRGVEIISLQPVTGFEKHGKMIQSVITPNQKYQADAFVMANGCWMPLLAAKLGLNILMQPGKGYSITYPSLEALIHHPAILVDHRVALTPLPGGLRMAGTMEISGYSNKAMPLRIEAIKKAVPFYYPEIKIEEQPEPGAWSGFRPLSPDGLPYIGRHKMFSNLVFAGGHAMLGLSLATGTGLLVQQIISSENTSMPVDAFNMERFG